MRKRLILVTLAAFAVGAPATAQILQGGQSWPLNTTSTLLTLPVGDAGPHLCPDNWYVVSVQALSDVDNANVRVTLLARRPSTMTTMGVGGGGYADETPGQPLRNPVGFRLTKPAKSQTVARLICGVTGYPN